MLYKTYFFQSNSNLWTYKNYNKVYVHKTRAQSPKYQYYNTKDAVSSFSSTRTGVLLPLIPSQYTNNYLILILQRLMVGIFEPTLAVWVNTNSKECECDLMVSANQIHFVAKSYDSKESSKERNRNRRIYSLGFSACCGYKNIYVAMIFLNYEIFIKDC